MPQAKNNRVERYIVTWKPKTYTRKEASFDEQDLAESFYEEKLNEGKSPSLYVTELIESTRQLK